MAYKTGALFGGVWSIARQAAAVITADNSTLSDANIPPDDALNCQGLESIWVAVDITGGASPTMTLEALFRDAEAANGSRWVRNRDATGVLTTPALAPGQAVEVRVDDCPAVFLRVTAVANAGSTTAWKILVRPGKRR